MSKNPSDINIRAADMWSYAVLLWELVSMITDMIIMIIMKIATISYMNSPSLQATREIPFGDLSPMEAGMRVR